MTVHSSVGRDTEQGAGNTVPDSTADRITSTPGAPDGPELSSGKSSQGADKLFRGITVTAGAVIVALIALIAVVLLMQAIPSINADNVSFLLSSEWNTTNPSDLKFGILDLLKVTVLSSVFALLLAVPVAIGIANIGQAAPAIGLLVLLFLATNRTGFWIGVLPVAFYSLLPVLRNTIVGIRNVDPALIDAARGQGMSAARVLRTVELPLAVPFILAGLRTTLVLAVGTATLSFLVDAGGLGIFIDTGYRLQDYTTLIVGSVLAVCLALFVDWLGGVGERLFNPKGLR